MKEFLCNITLNYSLIWRLGSLCLRIHLMACLSFVAALSFLPKPWKVSIVLGFKFPTRPVSNKKLMVSRAFSALIFYDSGRVCFFVDRA